ncbi:AAA family ATPase [Microbacterium sp. CSI-V]|uniref:ATP-binding protein n=1 Tax=Microbacterium sp. CSI-V TaxID=1933777 RepID=UPI00097C7406|nr:ATP-binding protein [Microbacterium sp. CSI-V]ONI65110.1 AAA family ATPase [Microbacterium sp. CSI-V]
MTGSEDFVEIIRAAVEADPGNVGLRVDLVELLLQDRLDEAAAEIEQLSSIGANAATVLVLRARLAAARLRAGQVPDAAPPVSAEPSAPERPAPPAPHINGSFLLPMRNPEMARMFGKAPRGSLLMYGPPGCGKTFIARAIAGELDANFVHATLADIVRPHFGETEQAIHSLFEAARAARPCVVFIDEFDAIGGRRSSGSSSAQSLRMFTSQLLEEFDGVDADNDGVYILAATNRPWDIDPALRRPGRVDRTVLVLPPDEPARRAIIEIALRDKPAASVDAGDLARRTTEFSGADIAYIVDQAVETAFTESVASGVPRMIGTADLERAAARIIPSTREWFEQIKPVLEYGVDDGTFGQLRTYLKRHRI